MVAPVSESYSGAEDDDRFALLHASQRSISDTQLKYVVEMIVRYFRINEQELALRGNLSRSLYNLKVLSCEILGMLFRIGAGGSS